MTLDPRVLLSRLQVREQFVMRETADIYISHLNQFAQTDPTQALVLEAAAFDQLEQAYGFVSQKDDRKPFVYQDGVAIIPIHGGLLNRFGGSWGFVTGYNYIRRMMNAAVEDDDVKLIVYDVDSPGGEAAGCFELAEEIRDSRESKPSIAVVDALSASAGYALASAATQMVATPSSRIGSIGVYRMHIDVSGMMDQAGIKITFIEAPKDGLKTAGNAFAPLSKEAEEDFQRNVDMVYDDFIELVATNREISEDQVRDTKARVYRADESLALGLIDAVRTPSEAVSTFLAELADDEPQEDEDEDMSKTPAATGSEATSAAPAAAAAAPAAPSQEQIDAAIRADRERMSAIKALPESAERPKLADKLALDGMSVEQAKGILGVAAPEIVEAKVTAPAAPAAETVDTTNHLAAAMDGTKHPNVGAGDGGAVVEEAKGPEDLAAAILADQSAVTGFKPAKAA